MFKKVALGKLRTFTMALGKVTKTMGESAVPLGGRGEGAQVQERMQVPFSSACCEKGALQWAPKANDTKGKLRNGRKLENNVHYGLGEAQEVPRGRSSRPSEPFPTDTGLTDFLGNEF